MTASNGHHGKASQRWCGAGARRVNVIQQPLSTQVQPALPPHRNTGRMIGWTALLSGAVRVVSCCGGTTVR